MFAFWCRSFSKAREGSSKNESACPLMGDIRADIVSAAPCQSRQASFKSAFDCSSDPAEHPHILNEYGSSGSETNESRYTPRLGGPPCSPNPYHWSFRQHPRSMQRTYRFGVTCC